MDDSHKRQITKRLALPEKCDRKLCRAVFIFRREHRFDIDRLMSDSFLSLNDPVENGSHFVARDRVVMAVPKFTVYGFDRSQNDYEQKCEPSRTKIHLCLNCGYCSLGEDVWLFPLCGHSYLALFLRLSAR